MRVKLGRPPLAKPKTHAELFIRQENPYPNVSTTTTTYTIGYDRTPVQLHDPFSTPASGPTSTTTIPVPTLRNAETFTAMDAWLLHAALKDNLVDAEYLSFWVDQLDGRYGVIQDDDVDNVSCITKFKFFLLSTTFTFTSQFKPRKDAILALMAQHAQDTFDTYALPNLPQSIQFWTENQILFGFDTICHAVLSEEEVRHIVSVLCIFHTETCSG
jgi:hypothetical protein